MLFSNSQVNAELRYSRESLRVYYYLRHSLKTLRYVAAGYFKGLLSETTLCSPFPVIPGYTSLCNYTHADLGNSWYCGQPRKLGLTCADWNILKDMEFIDPFPINKAEMHVADVLGRPPKSRLIPSRILIKVEGGAQQTPAWPCPVRNMADTWRLGRPRGYFLHQKWFRTDCKQTHNTPDRSRQCFRNTTLVLAGDSNLMKMFEVLASRMQCTVLMEPGTEWHRPRSCVREDIQFHMSWLLHGFPNHPGSDHWAKRSQFQEVSDQIRAVPDKGKYIVLVHLFIHYSIHHYSVLYDRLLAVRKATELLLRRNPDVKVVIRGPHVAQNGWPPILGGDMAGPLMRELHVKAFQGLHERVAYIDFWDMTIAGENPDFHPVPMVNNAMVDVFMDHVCS